MLEANSYKFIKMIIAAVNADDDDEAETSFTEKNRIRIELS